MFFAVAVNRVSLFFPLYFFSSFVLPLLSLSLSLPSVFFKLPFCPLFPFFPSFSLSLSLPFYSFSSSFFDLSFTLTATVSPAHCLVDGPGLEDGEASASSRIEVTLCDGEGRELSASITSAVVEAEVFSSGAIVTVVGRPDGDGATAKGRVGLSYPRETAGVSTVIVRVNGEPIGGSPFHVATTAGERYGKQKNEE